MKITFFGAAQNVTGSKHLIQIQGYNLLLDCGMYQGRRGVSNQLNSELPFSAEQIDAVILSHAHIDHSGLMPVLTKSGFRGKIYCTPVTAEITKYLLQDSASIQEHDCEYFNGHLRIGEDPISPIYTIDDVEKTFDRFEPVQYFSASGKWTELNENIRFKLYDAGHILGSAIILLEVKENGAVKNLIFTGDLGRDELPILRSPEMIEEGAATMIMECTYGGRNHGSLDEVMMTMEGIIKSAVKRRSKVIVPAFALGRTQELIYVLHKLTDQKRIPALPIYFDSPLAQKLTAVFSRFTEYFDEEFWRDFGFRRDPVFIFKNLRYVETLNESKDLNNRQGPLVIIASSGMAEGGRILHHLKNNISNADNTILITGFQAENTLGRKIQDGVSPVRIFGESYDVKAKVVTLDAFSAHAGQSGLLERVDQTKGLQKLFLVHGELSQAEAFKKIASELHPELSIEIPALGQSFEI
ncbi:MAG: MBL fold metallo-hydrolase [Candidatus Paceibacterota bacterium]|jgi:metallo-beta-lactamase family protein